MNCISPLTLSLTLLLLVSPASACTCRSTSLQRQFIDASAAGTPVSRVTVLGNYTPPTAAYNTNIGQRTYFLRVEQVLGTCVPRQKVYLANATSALNDGLCGVFLENGETYYLGVKPEGKGTTEINLCGFIRERGMELVQRLQLGAMVRYTKFMCRMAVLFFRA